MPQHLSDWHDRIKAVEREYLAVRASVVHMQGVMALGGQRPGGPTVGDLIAADSNLEATYLIRIWAEFETAIRSYYGCLIHDPESRIRAQDLINAVAGVRRGRSISEGVRQAVHRIRDYRNTLVHARSDPAPAVSLIEARRYLNTYLCKLPETWG